VVFVVFAAPLALGVAVEHSAWLIIGTVAFVWVFISALRYPTVQCRLIARLEAGRSLISR
jgi:hypothetical protein